MSGSRPYPIHLTPYRKIGPPQLQFEGSPTAAIKSELWRAAIQDERRLIQQRRSSLWHRLFPSELPISYSLQRLQSILGSEGKILEESLFNLAEHNVKNETHPVLTQKILEFTSQQPSLKQPSEVLQNIIKGTASFFQKLEYQIPKLKRELFSPLNLIPFGVASFSGKLVTSAIFKGATRASWGTFLISESAALGAEVPVLVAARRIGTQMFVGGENLFRPQEIGKEVLATYAPFGFFRVSHNLFNFITPSLGQIPTSPFRFSSDLAAVMAGHSFNQAVGLSLPEYHQGFDALFGAVFTVSEIRLTGKIIDGAFGRSLRKVDWNNHLSWKNLQEKSFISPLKPAFAEASLSKISIEPILMANDSKGGGSGKDDPQTTSGKTSRAGVVIESIRKNLTDYLAITRDHDTVLSRAALRLKTLLDLWKQHPQWISDPKFAEQLSEIEQEIGAVKEMQSSIPSLVDKMKSYVRNSNAHFEEPLFEKLKENGAIEKDEKQRTLLVTSLRLLRLSLEKIGQRGYTARLKEQLSRATALLNQLWKDKVWLPPPSIFPLVSKPEQQRREGALLGLSTNNRPLGKNSPLAHELHSGKQLNLFAMDLELELLHQTILLTTTKTTKTEEELLYSVGQLAQKYQASEASSTAMILTAELLYRYFKYGENFTNLPIFLSEHPRIGSLRERIFNVLAFQDPKIELKDGLALLGSEAVAPDYLTSAIMLLMRAIVLMRANKDPRKQQKLGWLFMAAEASNVPGFHLSIPLSLFGAIYGRKNLPTQFVFTKKEADLFLEQALKESQEISLAPK